MTIREEANEPVLKIDLGAAETKRPHEEGLQRAVETVHHQPRQEEPPNAPEEEPCGGRVALRSVEVARDECEARDVERVWGEEAQQPFEPREMIGDHKNDERGREALGRIVYLPIQTRPSKIETDAGRRPTGLAGQATNSRIPRSSRCVRAAASAVTRTMSAASPQ